LTTRSGDSIPSDQLTRLVDASANIARSLLRRDKREFLRQTMHDLHGLISAEACAVFLVDDDRPNTIVLEERYNDRSGHDIDVRVELAIRSQPGGGLIPHAAATGDDAMLDGEAVRTHRNVRGGGSGHLIGNQCYSALVVVLKERRGRVMGVVIADNKRGEDGEPGIEQAFSTEDFQAAKLLCSQIVVGLDHLRVYEAIRDIMLYAHGPGTLGERLFRILRACVGLVRADRGDIALRDHTADGLRIRATTGPGATNAGDIVPRGCAARLLVRTPQSSVHLARVGPDTLEPHHPMYVRTRSLIAVSLFAGSERIGVLNVESFRSGFLDELDLEMLRLVAQHVGPATALTSRDLHFRGIADKLAEPLPSAAKRLDEVLHGIRAGHRFDAGLIDVADYRTRRLICSGVMGCEALDVVPREYSYGFDDRSLASWVRRNDRPYYAQNPSVDAEVNQAGRSAFGIDGPVFGVPLTFEKTVVGVLVVWSREGPDPTPDNMDELRMYASLAAPYIARQQGERQRATTIRDVQAALLEMQTHSSTERNLEVILTGVQAIGFARARVYEYRADEEAFVGITSVGMPDPEAFQGLKIQLDRNPYARDTAASIDPPSARTYNHTIWGPDPDAARLKKEPDVPWVAVPLVVSGVLYGQITADNVDGEITLDSLEYVELAGGLAAQMLVLSETLSREGHLDDLLQMIHSVTNAAQSILAFMDFLAIEDDEAEREELTAGLRMEPERSRLMQRNFGTFFFRPQDEGPAHELADLRDIVSTASQRTSARAALRNVDLRVNVPTDQCPFVCAEPDIAEVVDNLIDNALKVSAPVNVGGRIPTSPV
jgi:GAF domain-containing protein